MQSAPAALFSASEAAGSSGASAAMAVRGVIVTGNSPATGPTDIELPTTNIDIDSELREQARELFATLSLIAAQYAQQVQHESYAGTAGSSLAGGIASAGSGAAGMSGDSGGGSLGDEGAAGGPNGGGNAATGQTTKAAAVAPAIAASRRLAIELFIMGRDTNATLDMLSGYGNQDQATAKPTVTRQMKFEYWAEPMDSAKPVPIAIRFADASASQSFLHRMLCMVGLVSHTAAGLNEDCEYR